MKQGEKEEESERGGLRDPDGTLERGLAVKVPANCPVPALNCQ